MPDTDARVLVMSLIHAVYYYVLPCRRKVREHHRKERRESRKRKRAGIRPHRRKDPGIPNSWPFKEELLRQVAAHREREEARKQAAKDERKRKAAEKRAREREERAEARREAEAERALLHQRLLAQQPQPKPKKKRRHGGVGRK